ncbi:MAG: IclR family transcriptional regulator [Firmicutes bacterium]|nr:IclR family transcriptional regulator [Bacillota bacterium]
MVGNSNNYNNVTMVDRAINILQELFNSNEPMGVSQISQKLDLPKATVYRILNTLSNRNFIEKDLTTDKYYLGLIFIQYGQKVKSKLNLKNISAPFMEKLCEEIGETINLGIPYEGNVITIFSTEGESSVLVSKLIPISPLHCSSIGKILLSEMDENEIQNYFNTNNLQQRTINTIIDFNYFLKEREKILKEKISYDNEEYEYGLTCIAYPIVNKDGKIIAGLSISGPTSRLEFKGIDNLADKLKKITDDISKQIKLSQL